MKQKIEYWVYPDEYRHGYCPTVCDTLESAEKQKKYLEDNTDFGWHITERNTNVLD